jgi:NAD(P)-dependent dehydrogenase (short-subunit alcohol dehydrogenase family)
MWWRSFVPKEVSPMLLENRAALVTGGAGRIGRAIVEVLMREGARVVLADLRQDALDRAAAGLPGAATVRGDVTDAGEVGRMVDEAERATGPLDILVTSAGIFPNCPLLDMPVEEWERVFAVNVRGVMLCNQAMAHRWVARGTRGAIVNLSSGASRSARPGGSHYCASKAAVNMMTEVWASELGRHGIRVNTVLPGLVMDDVMTAEDPARHPYVNAMWRATPLGRTGDARDIAEAVAFLASDRSAWTTGATLQVSGGSHCGRTHVPLTRDMVIAPRDS